MKAFDIPVDFNDRVKLGEMFFLPPDVTNAIDLGASARVMADYGIIPEELATELEQITQYVIRKAVAERRVGHITDISVL